MVNKSDKKKGKSSSVVKDGVKSDASETVNPANISEEEIRELAEILFHQRIDREESGSVKSVIISDRVQRISFMSNINHPSLN